ncbi:LEAF RUST 10 DISEASE-RESISTANCE LOCUS RECEPTOR-LIKE PROTEIN KINASE-like 2.4 [Malania oleifera]|uniref:LEAF RUST 10 DISEASE-RESISTANCE LOCUS RECEPTOR-LIKE PROTEIN KINASE-like 2.4 n=1 Tax=Malania oleifera TaxID=397392 RepID=UPI0025AE41AD|nr:LEAF RUST 10 DISEASE-RESISTANCE LOCUS RECEPTOR-LIKE PROTEIN KINASE-like 2.4 [Malania oleifera]
MNFQIFSSFLSLFSIIELLVLIRIPLCLCYNDESYSQCEKKFSCGDSMKDVGYPFWGDGQRPKECGHPGFELICDESRNITTMPIMGVKYRVIELEHPILKIAREDVLEMLEGSCPTNLKDSILDLQHFDYHDEYVNITLLYNCPVATPGGHLIELPKPCKISDSNYTSVLPVISQDARRFEKCSVGITFPIRQFDPKELWDLSGLSGVVLDGFKVKLKLEEDENKACEECTQSGGLCGYDYYYYKKTACFCPNRPYFSDTKCAASTGHPRKIFIAKHREVRGGPKSLDKHWFDFFNCMLSSSWATQPLCCTHLQGQAAGLWDLPRKIFIGIAASVCLCMVGVFVMGFWILRKGRGKTFLSSLKMAFSQEKSRDEQNIKEFLRNYGSLALKRYKYSNVKKMTNSFSDKLGQGGYGEVYKGKLFDGRVVAVKLLIRKSTRNAEDFINEVASISRTSHVNIVTLLGFCYEGSRRALIYEFMPNGSLDKFIFDHKSPSNCHNLTWETLLQIAVGIARGLEYLHRGCTTRILHFDIKPHNILLDEYFCPKISDFGLSKLCHGKESIVSMMDARGTFGYIAPEVYCRNFGGVSYKSDVYSYGMLVLEMVGGRRNIDVERSHTSEIYFPNWIYKHLDLEEDLRLLEVVTAEEEEMARKMILVSLWCIQTIPSDRPSMTKVVEMLEGSLQSLSIPPKPTLSSP